MTDWDKFYRDAEQQAIKASLPGFTGKADAVKWYQQEYAAEQRKHNSIPWKRHIVSDLAELLGMKSKNLEKRFDAGPKGRLLNPEKRNDKQYQDLAVKLGVLKAPENGYHVHYQGGVQFSECEYREFTVDITDELADEVAADPPRVVDIAFLVWMQQEEEEEASAGPCDEEPNHDPEDPRITIRANEDDYKIPVVKRHKPAIPFFKRK